MPGAIPSNYLSGFDYTVAPPVAGDPTDGTNQTGSVVIDGTPARVAALGIAAVATLVGLRWAGFRFNVAVGN